jgi:hypothetical protein
MSLRVSWKAFWDETSPPLRVKGLKVPLHHHFPLTPGQHRDAQASDIEMVSLGGLQTSGTGLQVPY